MRRRVYRDRPTRVRRRRVAWAREGSTCPSRSGRGRLRFGDEVFAVRAGDCISARAGDAAHQIQNDYDIGSGVAAPPRSQYLRRGRVVDYWEGEE